MTEEEKEKRMRNCNHHVFAIIRKEYNSNGIWYQPHIECVRCGLTNKYIEDDNLYSDMFEYDYESMESKVFKELISINNINDLNKLDFLSKEVINVSEPFILYHLARKVNLSIDIKCRDSYPLIIETMIRINETIKRNNLDIHFGKDLLKALDLYEDNKTYKKEIK